MEVQTIRIPGSKDKMYVLLIMHAVLQLTSKYAMNPARKCLFHFSDGK